MECALEWCGSQKKMTKEQILGVVYDHMRARHAKRNKHKGNGIEARVVNRLDISAQRTGVIPEPLADDHCGACKETLAQRKPMTIQQAHTIAGTRMSEDGSPTMPEYLLEKKTKTELNPNR